MKNLTNLKNLNKVNITYRAEITNEKFILHIEWRCNNCNKLLAKTNSSGYIGGQIKCSRCGWMNER